jgi:hypothetical protein
MKGNNLEKSMIFSNLNNAKLPEYNDSDLYFFQQYLKPKVKIIPGIPTIERLPEDIENRESYFYSGPLIIMDKPSNNLSERLDEFLNNNKTKTYCIYYHRNNRQNSNRKFYRVLCNSQLCCNYDM